MGVHHVLDPFPGHLCGSTWTCTSGIAHCGCWGLCRGKGRNVPLPRGDPQQPKFPHRMQFSPCWCRCIYEPVLQILNYNSLRTNHTILSFLLSLATSHAEGIKKHHFKGVKKKKWISEEPKNLSTPLTAKGIFRNWFLVVNSLVHTFRQPLKRASSIFDSSLPLLPHICLLFVER